MKRLFIFEPGLREATGHPVQYAQALEAAGSERSVPVHVVCHRDAEESILDSLRWPSPKLRCHCFPIAPQSASAFAECLLEIIHEFSCNREDSFLIASAHVNEIRAVAELLKNSAPASGWPRIAMNFHQLFPPAPESQEMCTAPYQKFWMSQLRDAFGAIPSVGSAVSYWTTAAAPLKTAYEEVSGQPIGTLPFVFVNKSRRIGSPGIFDSPLRLAFLGDGRQEKGFLAVLEVREQLQNMGSALIWTLQNINPRGYSASERVRLDALLASAREASNVEFIERGLLPIEFDELLDDQQIVLLPYNPLHYDRRGSLLFVQAASSGKPVVVSNGTWMADEVTKGRAAGLIFEYVVQDSEATTRNLCAAIIEIRANYQSYRAVAEARSNYYFERHTAAAYLDALIEHNRTA